MTQKNRAAHPVFILKSFFHPPVSVPNNVYGFGIRQFFAVAAHCHQQKRKAALCEEMPITLSGFSSKSARACCIRR